MNSFVRNQQKLSVIKFCKPENLSNSQAEKEQKKTL
jgi:hypothetical protein